MRFFALRCSLMAYLFAVMVWVATKMGGPHAPDDLDQGHRTQVWLAVSDDSAAKVSSQVFFHMKPRKPNHAASDEAKQEKLLAVCGEASGVEIPA